MKRRDLTLGAALAFASGLLFATAPGSRAALVDPSAADAFNAANAIASGGPAAADRVIEKSGVARNAAVTSVGVVEPIKPLGLKPADQDSGRSPKAPKVEKPNAPIPKGDSQGGTSNFNIALGMFAGAVIGAAIGSPMGPVGSALLGILGAAIGLWIAKS